MMNPHWCEAPQSGRSPSFVLKRSSAGMAQRSKAEQDTTVKDEWRFALDTPKP